MVSIATISQYKEQLSLAFKLFELKANDYGCSWRLMRVSSLIDQLYIKARRIREIEEKFTQKIQEPIDGEFIGLINYSIMTIIQLDKGAVTEVDDSELPELVLAYQTVAIKAQELMEMKNHDYGDAWRFMSPTSFTDLILTKLQRIKQILTNKGITKVSEGIDSNLYDIINYSVFALIRMSEK